MRLPRLAAAFACLFACFAVGQRLSFAAPGQPEGSGSGVNWIWAPNAATGKVCFRKSFEIPRPFAHPTDEATLHITADNAFTVWLNGVKVGSGDDWHKGFKFDVNGLTRPGRNVLAVEAVNSEGPGGLLVRLGFIPNGMSKLAVVSDGKWRHTTAPAPSGWEKPDFDDAKWPAPVVLGPYGKTEPWRVIAWEGGGDERFVVPQGFSVETVVPAKPNSAYLDPKLPFSLINLCFDAKGRLLVSQERGPVLLCADPNKDGVFQTIKPYCTQVRGCQGMCWVDEALLLVGDGPQGTGLYRVKDNNGDDQTDEAELLLAVKGGMGEHGPHAIVHGPDNCLYLVMGNHSWAKVERLAANSPLVRWPKGQMGPDQGQPNTTEDVLLPRLNDARGHAAGILAPGGTIWRMELKGGEPSLYSAGFRNHFDMCFNLLGEAITFDSDMEWDEGLPWYRSPRVCHAFAGADFLWRTGASNTPNYYIDSLPPLVETGRGSPVGLETYDHTAFPDAYRGAVFLADWSAGKIFAMRANRGNLMGGVLEDFCVGTPMNVTDLSVGPDGALYFCVGGRGTEGGVFRIVNKSKPLSLRGVMGMASGGGKTDEALNVPQPWSAFGRAKVKELRKAAGQDWGPRLESIAKDKSQSFWSRLRALQFLRAYGPKPSVDLLVRLAADDNGDDVPFIVAQATLMLGDCDAPAAKKALVEALHDGLWLTRRRACETLLRAGIEPPLEALWPLLADPNRQVRTAARLLLQRADAAKWMPKFLAERSDVICMEAIVALCKTNQARRWSKEIAARLGKTAPSEDAEFHLDYLRVWQLVLIHAEQAEVAAPAKEMLERCCRRFPPADPALAREFALLITHGKRSGLIDEPVHVRLLDAMIKEKNQAQQIHYFYCLRLLRDGWTPEQKRALLAWFEGTKSWRGGFSFAPFLENIFRDVVPVFSTADLADALRTPLAHPHSLAALLRLDGDARAEPAKLLAAFETVASMGRADDELCDALVQGLGSQVKDERAQSALRKIGDLDSRRFDAVARVLANAPCKENEPYLRRGLESGSPLVCLACLKALREIRTQPGLEDPRPFRAVLAAAGRLDLKDRQEAVKLLRHWTGKRFTPPDEEDWRKELNAWGQWYGQTFPKEPPLANVASLTAASKWKLEDLLSELEKSPRAKQPDLARGRQLMAKANCLKCHKFGSEGEGVGPDLTTLRSKFKRDYILESILNPSKVVSDQYRGSVIQTKNGKLYTGLAAPQGDIIVLIQSDGTKVTLKTGEIESQVAATASPMPERLLDEMTLEEIADLIGYLESAPK